MTKRVARRRQTPGYQSIPPAVVTKAIERLQQHARAKYADVCREIRVEPNGPYLVVDALRKEGDEEWWVRLCRLEFIGAGELLWGFWFYSYAHDRYERNLTMKGRPLGTPEECFDCSAFAHLTGGDPTRISGTVY